MPKEKEINIKNESEVDEERIQFGEKTIVCFACGQKINEDMKLCPYCRTKQNN